MDLAFGKAFEPIAQEVGVVRWYGWQKTIIPSRKWPWDSMKNKGWDVKEGHAVDRRCTSSRQVSAAQIIITLGIFLSV